MSEGKHVSRAGIAALPATLWLWSALSGCGTSGGGTDEGASALNDAWNLYHNRSWAEARSGFLDLVAADRHVGEAYCGLGWCRLHLLQPDQALGDFQNSLWAEPGRQDSRAGEAFAQRDAQNPDYDRLLLRARNCLQEDPDYSFEHESGIDWADLHILMAQTFFYRQEFDSTLGHCQVVDPDMSLSRQDTTSWNGQSSFELALFDELQRLTELVGGD